MSSPIFLLLLSCTIYHSTVIWEHNLYDFSPFEITETCVTTYYVLSTYVVVLEKTLESPLDCKESQPVHPKGDKSWVFIGRTDAEAETLTLWSPDAKSWLIGKDPDAREDWEQEEKGMTEDEMVGWHHRLNGHEFEWTLGVGDGQGGLACCGSWGCKELDMTEWLNWTELYPYKKRPHQE